jgi:integrase
MKKQITYKIIEIIKSQKYEIVANMGKSDNPNEAAYPRKYRTFYGTQKDAITYAVNWVYELEHPEEVKPTDTVEDWLNNWIDKDAIVLLSWERNTLDRAKRIIEINIKPHIGKKLLVDLTPEDVMGLYSKLSTANAPQKKLAPRTVRYVHTILNQALNHAVTMGKIPANPAKGLTPAASKSKDKEKWVVLDGKQLNKYLQDIIYHHDYAIIYVAAYTGARQSELLGLTWSKIWRDDKIIRIDQTLHKIKTDEYEKRPRTKNLTSTRSVKVTERAMSVLDEYKKQQEAKGLPTGPNDLVFTDDKGNPVKRDNLYHRYINLATKFGYTGMTFHHLRHTHATILLSSGANINEVSERLGHADPSITLSVYGHVLPGRDQSLAEKFDELIGE